MHPFLLFGISSRLLQKIEQHHRQKQCEFDRFVCFFLHALSFEKVLGAFRDFLREKVHQLMRWLV